jgi:hypothetical protein
MIVGPRPEADVFEHGGIKPQALPTAQTAISDGPVSQLALLKKWPSSRSDY